MGYIRKGTEKRVIAEISHSPFRKVEQMLTKADTTKN